MAEQAVNFDTEGAQLINPQLLRTLRVKFHTNSRQKDILTYDEFAAAFEGLIIFNDPATLSALIESIDINRKSFITWDDFTTYLINTFYNDISEVYLERLVLLRTAPKRQQSVVNTCMAYIPALTRMAPMLLTCAGTTLTLWNPTSLAMVKQVKYKDKRALYEDKKAAYAAVVKAQIRRSTAPAEPPLHPTTITCVCVLPITYHICIGTSDNCVSVYEPQNACDICARCDTLVFPPTTAFAYLHTELIDNDDLSLEQHTETLRRIVIGDSNGSLLFFNFDVALTSSIVKEVKPLELLHQHRYHRDRVTAILYAPELLSLLSASIDGTIAFVDPKSGSLQRTFNATPALQYKLYFSGESSVKGILAMDISVYMKWIVVCITRALVFIDPFTFDVIHVMETLTSPACFLRVNDSLRHLIVVCVDRTIRIYHIVNYALQQCIVDRGGDIHCCLYVPEIRLFYTAATHLSVWKVDMASDHDAHQSAQLETAANSEHELVCFLYADKLEHVIVVERSGVIRTYATATGALLGYFSVVERLLEQRHALASIAQWNMSALSSLHIHNAALDTMQKRLILSTQDHLLTIWNYLNGECLHALAPLVASLDALPQPAHAMRHNIQSLHYADIPSADASDGFIKYLFLVFSSATTSAIVQLHREIEDIKSLPSKFFLPPMATAARDDKTPPLDILWMQVFRSMLLVAYGDGSIQLWDLRKIDCTTSARAVESAVFTKAEPLIATASPHMPTANTRASKSHRRHASIQPPATSQSSKQKQSLRVRSTLQGRAYLSSVKPLHQDPVVASAQHATVQAASYDETQEPVPVGKDNGEAVAKTIEKNTYSIYCGVVLQAQALLIGGCSDSMIRFWSLPVGTLAFTYDIAQDLGLAEDAVNCIDAAVDGELVVGAFESGMVMVWSCENQILANRPNEAMNKTKAVSEGIKPNPVLSLEAKWRAHASQVIAVRCTRPQKTPEGLQALVITAGAQKCMVWTLRGESIGCYGPRTFSLEDSSTWDKVLLDEGNDTDEYNRTKRKSTRQIIREAEQALIQIQEDSRAGLIIKEELPVSLTAVQSKNVNKLIMHHPIAPVK